MTQFGSDLSQLVIKDLEDGLAAWFVEYGKIKTKETGTITPRLNPMQRDICRAVGWCLANFVPIRLVIVKPRQKGCSTITMALLYWFMCLFKADAAIMGGKKGHASNLWKIFQMYAASDVFDWGFDRPTNSQAASFSNGSSCQHETAKAEDAGRSATYQAVTLTECAYWHEGKDGGVINPNDVLSGMMNCVPDTPKSCIIMESTARGPTGYFYEFFRDAVTLDEALANGVGENGFIKIFSPWFDHDDSREWHVYPGPELHEKLVKALRSPETPAPSDVRAFLKEDRKQFENDLKFPQKYPHIVAKEQEMTRSYGLSPDQLRWYRKTWAQKCKKSMVQMNRDFPSTPEEAFYASSNQVFNILGMRHLRTQAERAMKTETDGINGMREHAEREHSRRMYGSLEGGYEDWQDPREARFTWQPVNESEKAYFTMWEPPRPNMNYLIACDTASGESTKTKDPDKHSVLVLRQGYYDPHKTHHHNGWNPHKVVARTAYECRWDLDILVEMVFRLHVFYGRCMVVPEYNHSSGGTLIKGLKDLGVSMYERNTEDISGDVRSPKETGKYGFVTTSGTRNYILDNLAKHIREFDTEGMGIEFFDVDAVSELENFVKTKRGRSEAAPGHHDDDVLSLAIGLNFVDSHSTRFVPPTIHGILPRDLQKYEDGNRRRKGQYS